MPEVFWLFFVVIKPELCTRFSNVYFGLNLNDMQLRLFFILLLLFSVELSAQINDTIVYPKGTVQGTLKNGFRYILQRNASPADKISVRLLVKVGSLNEMEMQKGIAHYIEHLAFNGSKKYPRRTAVKYWESLGAKFGVTINAYTGYDRTVYYLSIPSDKTHKNIQKTLDIYADWLVNLSCSPKSIEKERGIILQERANFQESDVFANAKKGNIPQLVRVPIASSESIKQIKRKDILQFYRTWYAPQNATLIVAGDIEPGKLEKQVHRLFGKLKKHGKTYTPLTPVDYCKKIALKKQLDTTVRELSMQVIFPKEYINSKTIHEQAQKEKERFVLQLLQQRLSKQKIAAHLSRYWYLLKTDFLTIETEGKTPEELYDNYQKTQAIVESVKKNGFFSDEVKDNLSKFTAKLKNRNFEEHSDDVCDNFIDMELFKERHISTQKQNNRIVESLEDTTLEQWRQVAIDLFTYKNRIILYTCNAEKYKYFSSELLLQAEEKAKLHVDTLFRYEPKMQEEKMHIPDILTKPIRFSSRMIKSEHYYPNLKLTEVILQNGARLLFRKIDSEHKKVNISIVVNGGLSLINPREYWKYEDVSSYMDLGGFKGAEGDVYSDLLCQEGVTYVNTIENYFHGCMLSGSVDKSEVVCNLLYHKFVYPELCYPDFEEIKQDEIKALSTSKREGIWTKNQLIKMDKAVEQFTGNVFPYAEQNRTKEQIANLNLDSIYRFYQKHFPVATNLNCIVLGNFNDKLKQNLIGTINRLQPVNNFKQYYADVFAFPNKTQSNHIGNKHDKRLYFRDVFYGDFKPDLRTELQLKLMRDILRNRLIEQLREATSLIYSPYITLKYRTKPKPLFYFSIDGTTNSANSKKVRAIIKNIIRELQNNKVSAEELEGIKRSFLITKKEYLGGDNLESWKDYLITAVKNNIRMDDIENYDVILKKITAEDIRKAFKEMVSLQNEGYFYVGTEENRIEN